MLEIEQPKDKFCFGKGFHTKNTLDVAAPRCQVFRNEVVESSFDRSPSRGDFEF